MSSNYTLRYRTLEQLLAEARSDMPKQYLSDAIKPHQLIKVATRVNYDLGLRIFQTKEAVLNVEKGRVKLPNDFYTLNYAFLCGEYTSKVALPQGTHIEERPLNNSVPNYQWQPDQIDTCNEPPIEDPCCTSCSDPLPCGCTTNSCAPDPKVCMNCKGEEWELVQIVQFQTRTYKEFYPLKIISSDQTIECGCPNLYMNSKETAWIKDGWLYTSQHEATVYINYQGMLEDADGNILVPDHPRLNEYYEYAMKERILENQVLAGAPVSSDAFKIISRKLYESRNNARSLVSMPNFEELRKVWQVNRKAQYAKYYDMFSSFSTLNHQNYRKGINHNQGNHFLRT